MKSFFVNRYTKPPAVDSAITAENSGRIQSTGDRYTTIKISATTPNVVSNNEESIPSKAPNKSPSSAPIPVTFETSPTLLANSAESSRRVSITSGSAGLLLGSKSVAISDLNGRFTSSALPSSEGKAKICSPSVRYFEIGTSVPIICCEPSLAKCSLSAAIFATFTSPTYNTRVGRVWF